MDQIAFDYPNAEGPDGATTFDSKWELLLIQVFWHCLVMVSEKRACLTEKREPTSVEVGSISSALSLRMYCFAQCKPRGDDLLPQAANAMQHNLSNLK